MAFGTDCWPYCPDDRVVSRVADMNEDLGLIVDDNDNIDKIFLFCIEFYIVVIAHNLIIKED